MKNLIFVILFALLFSACHDDELAENDYLIFGTAYGECLDNCATFYKIQNEKLYFDNMDYFSENYSFEAAELANSKYVIAKQLFDDMPEYLRNNTDQTFGCPDCADQGGIHIVLFQNGKTESWHIDTNIEQQPEEIRNYVAQVLSVMEEIQ
jgi:hypothetical protein